MGGSGNISQRSSSPMKRRASELEKNGEKHVEDVEMKSPDLTPALLTSNLSKHVQRAGGTSSGSSPKSRGSDGTESIDLPSVDEQVEVVTRMIEVSETSELTAGTKVYLVSQRWLRRVQARATGAKAGPQELDGDIGPIDNADLVHRTFRTCDGNNFAQLKKDLQAISYVCFPEEAWKYIVGLYGIKDGDFPIMRLALNTNPDPQGLPNVQYELHPPVFRIHRLWSHNSPVPLPQILKANQPETPLLVMSRGDKYVSLLRQMKKFTGIEMPKRVQVWRIIEPLPAGQTNYDQHMTELSPPNSRSPTPAAENPAQWTSMLVDVDTFNKLERGLQREKVDMEDFSANAKYNGSSTIDMASLGADQALVLDEIAEGNEYLSRYVPRLTKTVPFSSVRHATATAKGQNHSGRNSPALSGVMTRGRTQKAGRTPGCVGLSNLGNTCYMNSALQCVRSVEELTKYFLSQEAAEELNVDNPLGNNGQVALAYGHLLEDMYKDPGSSSVAPRQFKNTIGRYAPSFSGYGQQDSQEFLGFLLDGLQEDLSRIKKKPYIEKPDSTDDMVGNPQKIREMAAKVWDITKRRDDSVIADLFTGMYKSTLVCPVCSKVSITFDPFNNLTLQLPIENAWNHTVTYWPLAGVPLKVAIDLDKQASIRAMKEFIGKRMDVPADRLFVAEDFRYRFYKYFDDLKPASEEILANDSVNVYELEAKPTNWPVPKQYGKQKYRSMLHVSNESDEHVPSWDDPISKQLLVPVIHRRPLERARFNRANWEGAPVPHFIVLTPEEARNEDVISRKILEKVATLTTHPWFHEGDEAIDDSSDNIDADLVVTTSSDADSSGDCKVVASSVDGEDDVVDVAMKDSSTSHTATARGETRESFNRHQRRNLFTWDQQGNEALRPTFQNLFDLTYWSSSREVVPIGWSGIEEDKEYPKLSSRLPKQSRTDLNTQEGEAHRSSDAPASGAESSESEEDEDIPPLAATRMNDESSDEDDLSRNHTSSRALPVRPFARKPPSRGVESRSHMRERSEDSASEFDGGPLIRVGEGIVVDWNARAYDAVFGGGQGDSMRGSPTYLNIQTLDDPDLDARRKARSSRRKKGVTLDECLDEFGKEEILSEMDTWYCPRCKEHRRASKKFELWKTPDILVMHLKRFSSNAMRRDKLDVTVDFPITGLDLTKRVIDQDSGKPELYDLFAVDDHWGGLGGGHYTAYAKSFVDGEWYEYNDSSVQKQKDVTRIVSSGAYLLFYRRRSDVPLGGPRFKEIIERYDNPPVSSEGEFNDSGEDQRLGIASSLPGSSNALTGVGAIHQVGGSGSSQRQSVAQPVARSGIVDPVAIERLPSYVEHLEEDDGAPLLSDDADMNDGIKTTFTIDDEAIDMGTNYHSSTDNQLSSVSAPKWNFANLPGLGHSSTMAASTGDASDVDARADLSLDGRSDIVQNSSTADAVSIAGRLQEFEHAEPEGGEWDEPSPVPDLDEDQQMAIYSLREDLAANGLGRPYGHGMPELKVPPEMADDTDQDDEEATEIHIEEGEGLKMD